MIKTIFKMVLYFLGFVPITFLCYETGLKHGQPAGITFFIILLITYGALGVLNFCYEKR